MAKKKRFVFLSQKFYNTYPTLQYPEMEQKQNRPYIQVYVEIDGVQYAIPLRSDIHHPHVLWTDKKAWGELSGYREQLKKRNRMIINKFQYGVTIEELSKEYFLSEETVKKIVYSKGKADELLFYPHIESAKEYDEHGFLEEWIHTYLLFERKNRAFSDGLYLEERYYIGPIRMPVNFFHRSSGPEEGMKWRVDETVFEERTNRWIDRIKLDKKVPPLIISYFDNTFEINCNSPLHEALVRMNIKEFPVIIWITLRKDYEDFKQKYSEYVKFDYN